MTAILTALAVIVLAIGSILMLLIFLATPPPDPTGADDSILGILIAIRLVWPVVLVITGVLGGVATLLGGQLSDSAVLIIGVAALYGAVRYVMPIVLALNSNHLPLRGLPAIFVYPLICCT